MTKLPSTDQLIEDLKAFIRDGEALLQAFAHNAGEGMHEAKERAQESLGAAQERLAQLQDRLLSEARTAMEAGETYLRDNPWKTIAFAAGIGFLIGTLLSRRRSE
jgi:ElaB/YqjD/DUF883 family membrane-anchored ribosome-binding protein